MNCREYYDYFWEIWQEEDEQYEQDMADYEEMFGRAETEGDDMKDDESKED